MAIDFEDPALLFVVAFQLQKLQHSFVLWIFAASVIFFGFARFKTNADQLPGVERLAVMEPDLSYLEEPYQVLQPWGAALKVALRVSKWMNRMSLVSHSLDIE